MDVYPDTSGGINQITVAYSGDGFLTENPIHSSNYPLGSMGIITNTSFTVAQAEKMSVAVYMNQKPTFVMQGKPNGQFTFNTHPTYYLCVTDKKDGVAVDGSFVSSPTEIVFEDGVTDLCYSLTDTLTFKKEEGDCP